MAMYELDEPPDGKFLARVIHHKSKRFPLVPPDMYYNEHSGKHESVKREDRRGKYLKEVNEKQYKNGVGPNRTFTPRCRHYVKGALYKDVRLFHKVPLRKARKNHGDKWEVTNYSIEVTFLDENDNEYENDVKSVIRYAHTPLRKEKNRRRNLEKYLYDHATAVIANCREGMSVGTMAISGTRAIGNNLSEYSRNKIGAKLEKSACTYFKKNGFLKSVNENMEVLADCGGCQRTLAGTRTKYPWCTMVVVSRNLGNETHIDVGDGAPGIAIWHEETPGNIGNWFFLFPDMEIWDKGEWRKGVAIPLCHGAVVSWDGSIIRHASAIPTVEKQKNGEEKSVAWGTFFGTSKAVVSNLRTHIYKQA